MAATSVVGKGVGVLGVPPPEFVFVGEGEGEIVVVDVAVGFTPSNGSILSLKIKYPPAAIAPKIATVAAVAARGFPPL